MAEKPMLSVIVPVYNAEKTLEECLNSILQQTYKDYEILLINDGSKDKSGELCDKYASSDKRFRVLHTENRGVSSARNTGLDLALGKYVMFIDSDDSISPDYFETYINYIEMLQGDVVIGGLIRKESGQVRIQHVSRLDKTGNEVWEDICINPEMYGYIAGKIFRLNTIKGNNVRFSEKMYAQEDLDFNLSIYENCNRVETIDYAGYKYEYVPGKRKPPVWDFLANSLKMHVIASQKISLSNEAEEALKSRVVNQFFALLYGCNGNDEYAFAIEKLRNVRGLSDYLKKQKLSGEKRIIIKWFLTEKYERVYQYFLARKRVKKLLGLPVSE